MSRTPETTIQMPRPLCRICMGDNPKLRQPSRGVVDLVCDGCWGKEVEPAIDRAAGFRLAARVNEAFRRHRGLSGYVHASNRVEDEHCMYDALEELGMLPQETNHG